MRTAKEKSHFKFSRSTQYAVRSTIGFTLVELLVALTVMMVIVTSVVVVFRGASSAWLKGERTAHTYQKARTIM
ncbi:MAG: prepilin-type N-terminal cleavage/methylation domain-containing protein, partial [Candidatus Omnitrophica bacterium]|nr:prepilin-type N-terminal cleavage/methylation domain-containing protein [Candidatus Omnitrophota bacterium]